MIVEHLDSCDSTQAEVRLRLALGVPGECAAVSSTSQRQGRGRGGREWQDPTGAALMVSIGRRGAMSTSVLDGLPRRVAQVVLDALRTQLGADARAIAWKAPNDLVGARDGAKLAGILVDARTVGDVVDEVIVGIGINLAGPSFPTADGRDATSVEVVCGRAPDHALLLATVALGVAEALVTPMSTG